MTAEEIESNENQFYIQSDIDAIHFPKTEELRISYNGMLRLMKQYAEHYHTQQPVNSQGVSDEEIPKECPECKGKTLMVKHDKTRIKCFSCAYDWELSPTAEKPSIEEIELDHEFNTIINVLLCHIPKTEIHKKVLKHPNSNYIAEFITEYMKENLPLKEKPKDNIPMYKLQALISALVDIRNWDDELEDEWEDPGYRAREALKIWLTPPTEKPTEQKTEGDKKCDVCGDTVSDYTIINGNITCSDCCDIPM